MAIFKCKMCGGDLEIDSSKTIATCMYCSTKQTLPRLDTSEKETLYKRASHFMRNYEYEKAEATYDKILDMDDLDAETYWSLVLCKFGIEYVKDPATKTRKPTINRMQYTSIFADENYKSALKYADPLQKPLYMQEAKEIAQIQEDILKIANNEQPFDIFICYKETDANGNRTRDSVFATDLYHQLTGEGYKVFFAKITLEDKLGTAYEPYIFSALNSAKIMVVLGSQKEYFNAVWVKNEWARFLALIKGGAKKTLIPAYRDMDPYDLPEEFSLLQALDMGKIGFMQDLLRGIKKILTPDSPTQSQSNTSAQANTTSSTIAPLMKRVDIYLNQRDFDKANEYCEKVLDIDPENYKIYLKKILVEYKVATFEELKTKFPAISVENNKTIDKSALNKDKYYQSALSFAKENVNEVTGLLIAQKSCLNQAVKTALSQKDFYKADMYLNTLLVIEPENYLHYLNKILVECNASSFEELKEKFPEYSINNKQLPNWGALNYNTNYISAINFAKENSKKVTNFLLAQKSSLTQATKLALNQKDFIDADIYLNTLIKIEPENYFLYLNKIYVQYEVSNFDELKLKFPQISIINQLSDKHGAINNNPYYINALEYAKENKKQVTNFLLAQKLALIQSTKEAMAQNELKKADCYLNTLNDIDPENIEILTLNLFYEYNVKSFSELNDVLLDRKPLNESDYYNRLLSVCPEPKKTALQKLSITQNRLFTNNSRKNNLHKNIAEIEKSISENRVKITELNNVINTNNREINSLSRQNSELTKTIKEKSTILSSNKAKPKRHLKKYTKEHKAEQIEFYKDKRKDFWISFLITIITVVVSLLLTQGIIGCINSTYYDKLIIKSEAVDKEYEETKQIDRDKNDFLFHSPFNINKYASYNQIMEANTSIRNNLRKELDIAKSIAIGCILGSPLLLAVLYFISFFYLDKWDFIPHALLTIIGVVSVIFIYRLLTQPEKRFIINKNKKSCEKENEKLFDEINQLSKNVDGNNFKIKIAEKSNFEQNRQIQETNITIQELMNKKARLQEELESIN